MRKLTILLSGLAVLLMFGTKSMAQTDRMQWWRDARFGMFIHWDRSSVAGTEISWSRLEPKPLDGPWGGATYKGKKVWIHLFDAAPETLELPKLNQKLVSWKNLTASKITVTDKNGRIILTGITTDRISPDTIVELVFDQCVTRVDE